MTSYAKHFSTRITPQSEPIPGKMMIANSAGGYTFMLDDWARLQRFLILGNDGGTYYASERKLTIENAQCVIRCLDADPLRAVQVIADISDSGRAPKNDPAVFALAIAAGHSNPVARRAAEASLSKVCRIGTHLFQFVGAVKGFRGGGAGLRKAIAGWYQGKNADQLAYQAVKYQQREGWGHRDILRLLGGKCASSEDLSRGAVLRWMAKGANGMAPRSVKRGEKVTEYPGDLKGQLPPIIQAFEEAKSCDRPRLLTLIRVAGLPREAIPTEALNNPAVWEALLPTMPLTALVRNLGKMSAVGLLKPMSASVKMVADRLADQDYIQKSRLHPMAIILAAKTYGQGHGEKGKLSWQPVSQINDALDAAFYLAFKNVEPTGKRTLLALDVSGSMSSPVAGSPLSCREATAVMAMVTAKTEPNYQIMAFSSRFMPIDISGCSRLTDVVHKISGLPFERTDCSLPMAWAIQNNIDVDSFVIFTDNETFAGNIHPSQALALYRQQRRIPAKLAVQAFTATECTIADPSDGGMLDVCGLDASSPAVMADFFRS